MTKEMFETMQQWQQGGGNRTMELKFGSAGNNDSEEFWLYDFDYQAGAFVKTVEDIHALDLKAKAIANLQERLAELQTI